MTKSGMVKLRDTVDGRTAQMSMRSWGNIQNSRHNWVVVQDTPPAAVTEKMEELRVRQEFTGHKKRKK